MAAKACLFRLLHNDGLAEGNEIEDHELMDFLECVSSKDVEISKIPKASEAKSKAWMNVTNVLVPLLSASAAFVLTVAGALMAGRVKPHCNLSLSL